MASFVYNRGAYRLASGATVWTSGAIKALLLKGNGYTPDRDHNTISDLVVASNEVTVTGYARKTLAGKTVTEDDTNDRVVYDADDLSWASLASGETGSALVIFEDLGGADADNPLLAYIDLTDTAFNGGQFDVQFATSGCFYLTTNP